MARIARLLASVGEGALTHTPVALPDQSKLELEVKAFYPCKEKQMPHSTVTKKGQTTIPGEVRKALRIKPGDVLEYALEEGHATIRVYPGTISLKGALASDKGRGRSFAQIRRAAVAKVKRRRVE
jgi:AbrB family looped-hinge helix DNA binding protein